MNLLSQVTIVEVGPRDGFQNEKQFIWLHPGNHLSHHFRGQAPAARAMDSKQVCGTWFQRRDLFHVGQTLECDACRGHTGTGPFSSPASH